MFNSKSIENHHQQMNTVRLDETDLIILRELSKDARTPNNLLASRAGIAPSTCLGRVRALQEAGVIRGFHADINPRLLGLQITAMISVMIRPDFRHEMLNAARSLRSLAEVHDVFVLGGTPDILVHVICRSVEDLRDFVAKNIGAKAAFASTQTNLVFEHLTPEVSAVSA